MHSFNDREAETIEKEVAARFNQLVSAVNRLDVGAWSDHYSREGFISAIAGTDCYGERDAWVEAITRYFAMRESQHIAPREVRVRALTPELALMTSAEDTQMRLKGGDTIQARHVFTMIWKKEQEGWKILHSHESWVDGPVC